MKIQIELNNDVAARLKMAAQSFDISEGELINAYLSDHTRERSNSIPVKLSAQNVSDIFNGLQDALPYFETLLREIKRENAESGVAA